MKAPTDPILLAAWIEHAPAFNVAGWLEDVAGGPFEGRWICEEAASLRRDPIIDLALAQWSWDTELLSEMWDREDPTLRRAILTNQNSAAPLSIEQWLNWIEIASPDEVRIYATNPAHGPLGLRGIFTRGGRWGEISDKRWVDVGTAAFGNPVLRKNLRWQALPRDGWEDYMNHAVLQDAFVFLLQVPPTLERAQSLLYAMDNVACLEVHVPAELAKRSLGEMPPAGSSPEMDRYWGLRRAMEPGVLGQLFKHWTPPDAEEPIRTFAHLRRALASKLETHNAWMMRHADRDVRIGGSAHYGFDSAEELWEFVEAQGIWDCMEVLAWNRFLHSRQDGSKSRRQYRKLLLKTDALLYIAKPASPSLQRHDRDALKDSWKAAADFFHSVDPDRYHSWDERLLRLERALEEEDSEDGWRLESGEPGLYDPHEPPAWWLWDMRTLTVKALTRLGSWLKPPRDL
jgi:hypothetical protein